MYYALGVLFAFGHLRSDPSAIISTVLILALEILPGYLRRKAL